MPRFRVSIHVKWPHHLNLWFSSINKAKAKVKSLCLTNSALRHEGAWVSGGIAPPVLTSELVEGEWSASRPGRFTPGEIALGTRWIVGWVGPWSGLDTVERRKILPLLVSRRYTDWAVPALNKMVQLQTASSVTYLSYSLLFISLRWSSSSHRLEVWKHLLYTHKVR
jgi:hypothetical protein